MSEGESVVKTINWELNCKRKEREEGEESAKIRKGNRKCAQGQGRGGGEKREEEEGEGEGKNRSKGEEIEGCRKAIGIRSKLNNNNNNWEERKLICNINEEEIGSYEYKKTGEEDKIKGKGNRGGVCGDEEEGCY